MTNSEKICREFIPDRFQKMGFIQLYITSVRELLESKDLVFQLFRRDFTGVYRKSFLGMAWLVISPLVAIVSWIFMNSAGILKPGDVGVPYSLYVLVGSNLWGFFMAFYQAGSETLSSGAGFITQVNFPHQALLVKQVGHHVATSLVGFFMVFIVLLLWGFYPNFLFLLLPLAILPIMLLGSAIGLVISIFSVVALDISKVVTILLGLLMYATPVIFSPTPENQLLREIIKWNPMTYLISVPKDILLHGTFNITAAYVLSVVFSSLLFLAAWRFFIVTEGKTIEKLM